MKNTIRRYKLGYILGTTLCLAGVLLLLAVAWKAWPQVSSEADPMSAFWAFLWEEKFTLTSSVEYKLVYLLISAAAMLTSGIAVILFSRQRFFLPSKVMRLQCPFCKKQWSSSYDRGQVLCPHCHHLVHPKLIEE